MLGVQMDGLELSGLFSHGPAKISMETMLAPQLAGRGAEHKPQAGDA